MTRPLTQPARINQRCFNASPRYLKNSSRRFGPPSGSPGSSAIRPRREPRSRPSPKKAVCNPPPRLSEPSVKGAFNCHLPREVAPMISVCLSAFETVSQSFPAALDRLLTHVARWQGRKLCRTFVVDHSPWPYEKEIGGL